MFYRILLILFSISLISCTKEIIQQKLIVSVTPANGGSVSPPSNSYEKGSNVSLVATPSGEYLFKQWQGSISGTSNPTSIIMDADKSVTGVFEKRQYPLTLSIEGSGTVKEEVIALATQSQYPSGTTVRLTAQSADKFEFGGWSGDLNSNKNPIELSIDKSLTIKALFEPRNYLYENFNYFKSQKSIKIGKNEIFNRNDYNVITSADWVSFIKQRFKLTTISGVGVVNFNFNQCRTIIGDPWLEFFFNVDNGELLFIRFRKYFEEVNNQTKHFYLDEFKTKSDCYSSFESYTNALVENSLLNTSVSKGGYSYNESKLTNPPFSGTIFIDPNIITSKDSSTFISIKYQGVGLRTMYDRRNGGSWKNLNAHLFLTNFSDNLFTEIQINPEFSTEEAEKEARKYSFLIGQLPKDLRRDVRSVWIHKGTELFGGGNNNILIHTGQSLEYEKSGIIEETLIHEAAHTSIDSYVYPSAKISGKKWIDATIADQQFISNYAKEWPLREDIAESFLPYIAVKFKSNRISKCMRDIILSANVNRFIFFDSMNFDLSLYNK